MNRNELLIIEVSPEATQQVVFAAVKNKVEQAGSAGETYFSGTEIADMVEIFHAEMPAGTVNFLNSPDLSIGFQTEELTGMEEPADVRRMLEEHRSNLNYLAGLI